MPRTPRAPRARTLDARPDTLDFRDRMYVPTLVEVAPAWPLERYLASWATADGMPRPVPVLDQGREGACTGFGLAAVANYLLRHRGDAPGAGPVSPRMLYELARRYDEWPGQDYEGSSARGAMKGWHKHGVCSLLHMPQDPAQSKRALVRQRWSDAVRRPLGAYYRVNHRDLVAMHSALAEVGILYATGTVHAGWNGIGPDGVIAPNDERLGGHAFAIVAYDARGFWIQNSWGPDWGRDGFALVSYDDWLANGTDCWVARLGAPVELHSPRSTAVGYTASAKGSRAYAFCDLRPHVISIGNDGRLRTDGTYGTSEEDVRTLFTDDLPRITRDWKRKRVLLYAHGGLVPEDSAIQRLADLRARLLESEVYPVSFVWRTDYWTTLTNLLQDALARRRPEGTLDTLKDFMLDRLDDALEPLARALTGKASWDEMKENATRATTAADGGARAALKQIAALVRRDPSVEIHVAGHSAGCIFLAELVRALTAPAGRGRDTGFGIPVQSCALWAPACTTELFRETYLPALRSGAIRHFTLATLTDDAERDDHCASIYHKSLLYLVSHAFERKPRIPLFRDGVPILGMEKWIRDDRELTKLFAATSGRATTAGALASARTVWIRSPNGEPVGSPLAARAQHHGDFDDDQAVLQATLARILGRAGAASAANATAPERADRFDMHRSAAGQRALRGQLARAAT